MGAGIVRIVTDASFERDVLDSGRTILVAFGAVWCGPCQLMKPALRALAATHRDRLVVAKLDVEDSPATADRYGVETFPMGILFRDGEELARLDGYMPLRKIEALLAPHLEAPAS
ncbi:MAG TPA: thioredoxin domain-containing protein [Allosphingosinicella sp.]|nr:thioredoxin domain-containing protein [Allosphingosinicella sp.]